ncbi:putative elongator complex protein 1 [Coemansia helicoidea]|uniref:Elongator complex protein 1 n=1 Tax=Coemansia helicoidea TaxID=1286919 RepID=A0ACC1LAV1_9FUNG|nr:putative elongator complex protein 1 [Coemansia helicoidea]
MADLPEFMRQVDDFDPLNLFATALRDEDVTKSMYAGMDGGTSESKCTGKTNAACRALRPVLQLLGQQRYVPTMLTTLVCQSPVDIPGAMQLLSPLDAEARDAALMCLLYLSDVDTVYNAALGMYDLPLALVVAQHSQHDPRAYLPALSKVHPIPSDECHRRKVDDQLACYDQALQPRTTRLCCHMADWRTASGFSEQTVHDTAVRASAILADRRRFADAAAVLLDYAGAHEDAMALLDVEEIITAFATKVARLREVRATPLEVLAAAHVEMRAGGGEVPDNVEVMSGMASMASQLTTFTGTATNASTAMTGSTARRASKARMRKKEEKRCIRGRRGSIYEEAYLVDSVAKLIDRVRALQPSVRSLCLALIQFDRPSAAQQCITASLS